MNYQTTVEQILVEAIMSKRKIGSVREITLKSGKITYKARFKPTGKTPYHKTFKNKRDAYGWVAVEKVKHLKAKHASNYREVTFDDYVKKFLEEERLRVSYGTFRGNKCDVENHIMPILKGKKMINITFDDGVRLQFMMKSKNLNTKTINKVVNILKKIVKHASGGKGDHRIFETNPLMGLRSLPEINKDMDYWAEDEINYFLTHELVRNDFYFDFYRMTFNTGMRLGEVAGLQVKKIDFAANIIIVSNSLLPTEGGGYDLGPTKTKSTRYLKMNPVVREIMLKRSSEKEPNDYIFLQKNGKPIDTHHFTHREFRPLQKKLGVNKSIRFHDVRHTFASNYFMTGGNFLSAQDMLGHKGSEMTKRYIHISDQFKQNEADRIQF